MEALYLRQSRPDMAFMSDQGRMPIKVPKLQQTRTVKNFPTIKKTSIRLQQSSSHPHQYSLEFKFDAVKPCQVSVYMVALERTYAVTDSSSLALMSSYKRILLTKQLSAGSGQQFGLKKIENSSTTTTRIKEKHENILPQLEFSHCKLDKLMNKPNTAQFPLKIVLETLSDKCSQSQTTFCTFVKGCNEAWNVKVLKQNVLLGGLTYQLQEIYGIYETAVAAPNIECQAETSAGKRDKNIAEGAECIICYCGQRNTAVLPCRHMCLCSECADVLRKGSTICPICRTSVESLLIIRIRDEDRGDN
ncbi:hypothetical protein CCR75_000731 [Bremia lactucae]|uniref:RING-type domain-containing protein n=1 Tax=Bremia lactucae TaxID=4779 RepID=A0A976FIL3_BRELC|nr:hypothetical protein CCR75_000731 [Bremia lactucae]